MSGNVMVTGAADSIGRSVAEKFLERGFRVHICDVRADALHATLAANPGMHGTVADVGNPSDVAKLFADARSGMGEASVLVNTVGIGGPCGPLEEISLDEWRRTIEVNLDGTFNMMKSAIPAMKRAGAGSIINVSSGSTRTRLPMRAPYIASKYAIEGLTLNAARELGPFNIRCNAVLPGMVDNARNASIVRANAASRGCSIEEMEAEYLRFISLRSKVTPAEIADMIVFLSSEAASHVTGELIAVSGNLEWEQ